jgi:tRNA dimethylallyltransferase
MLKRPIAEMPDFVRAELEAETDTQALYERLRDLDPAASLKMEPNNRRRVVRALEVTLGSGRPFSSFGPGVGAFPPIDAVQIGIRWPRVLLRERIGHRVQMMMERGLLDEVTRLAATGLSITARQALGYKELLDHIEGEATIDEAIAAIVLRTRQFAVRQERWFRRDPRVRWLDIDPGASDPLDPVQAALEAALRK